MSDLELSLKKLESNNDAAYNEAVRLLIKIIDNVLKDPVNKKLRALQKNNATVSKKILAVEGGLDCLVSIGFVEVSYKPSQKTCNGLLILFKNGATFVLPESVTETHLKYVRDVFAKRKKGESVNLFSNLLAENERENAVSLQTSTVLFDK